MLQLKSHFKLIKSQLSTFIFRPSLNCLVGIESDGGGCYTSMSPTTVMRLDQGISYSITNLSTNNNNEEEGQCVEKKRQQSSINGDSELETGIDSSKTVEVPNSELELLAKLEEANRLIESDAKSLNSLSGGGGGTSSVVSGHSRKSSDTSQISLNSGKY